jgi:hypothetical protein
MSTLAVVTWLSVALLAQTASAAQGRLVSLTLPHSPGDGEVVWLEVKVGRIQRGAEIEVSTAEGQTLGVISPYGIRSGSQAGTYNLPVPPDAITDGRLKLRVTLNRHGRAERAPTAKELKGVRLKITRVTR